MNNIIKIIKDFSLIGKLSIIILILFLALGIFADLFTKHSHQIPTSESLSSPSRSHILGTDDLGIDIWAQIAFGARTSLIVGLGTALFSILLGAGLGIIAGYYGGKVDGIIMRFVDLFMVIPQLPTMIVLGGFFGPSIINIIIVLSLFSWARPARIVRSRVLSLKEENYVKVAKSYGANLYYINKKHFMPEIFPLIMVNFIRLISSAVVAEASLSFLGLGDPTNKSWGLMLNHAMSFRGIYFTDFWKWWILAPLSFIILLVLSISFISKEIENIYLGR